MKLLLLISLIGLLSASKTNFAQGDNNDNLNQGFTNDLRSLFRNFEPRGQIGDAIPDFLIHVSYGSGRQTLAAVHLDDSRLFTPLNATIFKSVSAQLIGGEGKDRQYRVLVKIGPGGYASDKTDFKLNRTPNAGNIVKRDNGTCSATFQGAQLEFTLQMYPPDNIIYFTGPNVLLLDGVVLRANFKHVDFYEVMNGFESFTQQPFVAAWVSHIFYHWRTSQNATSHAELRKTFNKYF